MSSTPLHIVKWTFPTLAIILGLFWYKRRRADRVDPGGNPKLDSDTNANNIKTTKRSTSLSDSGIHTDYSFALSKSCPSAGDDICSPRRVSNSLDIPGRKPPVSQPTSKKSSEENILWYDDEEDIPEPQKIKLGSNPRSSCFDMMSSSRSPFLDKAQAENNTKLSKVCDNIIEEDQVHEIHSTQVQTVAPEKMNNISDASVSKTCGKSVSNNVKSQVLSERDSANHSPVSGVLDGSLTDEARSEGSTDSGKGGSIKGHTQNNIRATYQFAVPQFLVGKLIGMRGSFLQTIRSKADVVIGVKRFPNSNNFKLCIIEGTPEGVNQALGIIRQKFPEKKYPNFSLEAVPKTPQENSWVSELMHLSLVEGVNNDVLVCYIVKPNRLFIHLPTHPTYPSLRILDENITQLYDSTDSPPVPEELSRGMIFVAKLYERWVRVYVENPDPKGEQHLVRLVDHGGYWTFSSADMRKIRSDYLTLPFQAIEVFIANIQPVNGEWQQGAFDLVSQICCGLVGQAQIEGYIDSHTYISLYLNIQKFGVISLADELIARGYAEPVSFEEVVPEVDLPIV